MNQTISNRFTSFFGQWVDLGNTQTSSRTIYFVAADTSQITDVFNYNVSSDGFLGTFEGFFQSSNSLGLLPNGVSSGDVFAAGTTALISEPFLSETVV
jgi:hypothetical protein